MTRTVTKLLFAAALSLTGLASRGLAQAPAAPQYYSDWTINQLQVSNPVGGQPMVPPSNPAATPAPTPNFETGWPRPPEEPPSLFRQAANPMPYGCAPIPGRYFEMDPLLDPPGWPQPGWVADLEIQAVG